VVCEAYEQHGLWADALFAQVVSNNSGYLQDFLCRLTLSSSLLSDLVAK
jgi:hypothetical protein